MSLGAGEGELVAKAQVDGELLVDLEVVVDEGGGIVKAVGGLRGVDGDVAVLGGPCDEGGEGHPPQAWIAELAQAGVKFVAGLVGAEVVGAAGIDELGDVEIFDAEVAADTKEVLAEIPADGVGGVEGVVPPAYR